MQKVIPFFLSLFVVLLMAASPPTRQGDSVDDRLISETIRANIVAAGTFSDDAQSIQIITDQREVSLLGTVDSEREKKAVIQIAKGVARVKKVYDNLVVVPR